MVNVGKLVGKLLLCGFYVFFLFSFLTKLYYNLYLPEFVADSLQYSPIYSSGDEYRSLTFSNIGNIVFSILAIYMIVKTITAE